MFQTIVVPCDLTHRNRPAVEMAARLVDPESGTVHLLHVIETIPGFSVDEESHFYGRLERAASEHLSALGKILEEKKIRFEAEVAYGPRAKTILEETRKLGCDLVVIQSHRVSEAGPQEGFGTLSYQIGIFAECPVLLVK